MRWMVETVHNLDEKAIMKPTINAKVPFFPSLAPLIFINEYIFNAVRAFNSKTYAQFSGG